MISTQIFIEKEQEEGYPAIFKIIQEDSSLVVHISLKGTWGILTSPDLSSFFDEFRKNAEQASVRAQKGQPALSSQKQPEGVKEPSLPSLSPHPPLSLSPPSTETPKISPPSFPRGKVIWVYVNLREGPGTQYKMIGKAFMKSTFEILVEHPDWLRVRLENGKEGWMSKKATESLTAPSSQSPSTFSDESSKTKFSSKPPSPM